MKLDLPSYLCQALVIAAALHIGGRKLSFMEFGMLTVAIVLTMVVLDQFAPDVAQGMKRGTGFNMGASLVEGYDEASADSDTSTNEQKAALPVSFRAALNRDAPYTNVIYGEKSQIKHPHLDRLGDDRLFRESFVGQTAAELGLVFGQAPITEKGHSDRAGDFLYSGDLLDLKTASGMSLMLPENARFVTMSSSGQLNKLRAVLSSGHVNDSLKPIKYGDPIRLVYSDSRGGSLKLSHEKWLQPAVSKRNQLFQLVNPANRKATNPVQLGDIVILSKATETADDAMLTFDEGNGRVPTNAGLKQATQFKLSAVRGCGPLWRFDSDTRGTNLKNPKQVRTLVERETRELKSQITALEKEYAKISSKCKLDCQQAVLKAKHGQGVANAPTPQQIAATGQLSALQQQVASLKNNLSVLNQYKKLLEHKYPVDQSCTAKGCGYSYKYDDKCVIGANDQQGCDQVSAMKGCHAGKKLVWVPEGRGRCRIEN